MQISKDKKNMTVTYLVNGKPISAEELKTIKITRKDYIDFVESLKKQFNERISEIDINAESTAENSRNCQSPSNIVN